ncbi:DUF397 domain-containing protein [Streptomyces sp. ET3-23]|uniref:DUF397 domain-containing protein n=1 Tax=Streptomyces sp. ET3-23 TaxID=2885643 RepID=UPI001D11BF38|nr:DUF397 domain-containing protein [Streptomyces sp. ET3-23]MCC2278569.1 DUF397 domain-containing protein [Streptomyces sp. ET3-23]
MSTVWIRSSHSSNGADGNACLEWAPTRIPTASVPIRDSKTAPHGATLAIPATAWQTFVAAISTGALH